MPHHLKLTLIKAVHTLIWLFFNGVIGYMLYAVISNKLDKWLWIGYGFVLLEGGILLAFKWTCPLTLLARKYSSSSRDNFDICLPEWLARNTKRIYTGLFLIIVMLTVIRLTSDFLY